MNLEKVRENVLGMVKDSGQPIEVKVSGRSMMPTINDGDTVIMDPSVEVKRGDIVVFYNRNKLVAHRVMRSREGHYITKGDSQTYFDIPVGKGRILGKVTGIKRNGKTLDLSSKKWAIFNHIIYWYSLFLGKVVPRFQ